MKKALLSGLSLLFLSGSVLAACSFQVDGPRSAEGTQNVIVRENKDAGISEFSHDEEKVTAVVDKFGQALRQVSVSAPEKILRKSIQEHYGDFISPELLSAWLNHPRNAPGRKVSSPWPDRIEILDIRKSSDTRYEVSGKIIEVTGVGNESGESAAERPLTLIVEKTDGTWLIDQVTFDDDEKRSDDAVVYQNTKYGFSFSLPKSWKDYRIVTDTWEGKAVDRQETVESGPVVSIRHPKWTSKNPRQDIPVMIFTLDQWESLQQEDYHIGAAPVGPKELGRNNQYVLALPARYNYAFPEGYEEVEEILGSGALQPMELE